MIITSRFRDQFYEIRTPLINRRGMEPHDLKDINQFGAHGARPTP